MDLASLITPPRKETLAANIAAQLKSLILKKKLNVGDRLPSERKLAELFKVSRVVIKQALLALEHSGFVEISLGSKGGAIVIFDFAKPLTIFMEDLHQKDGLNIAHFDELRKALENTAIRSAVENADERDIARLVEINEAFSNPENYERHGELNTAFHVAIADIAGNPLIRNLLKAVMELVFLYPQLPISNQFIKQAYGDHQNIIEAIRRRDVKNAEKFVFQNAQRVVSNGL